MKKILILLLLVNSVTFSACYTSDQNSPTLTATITATDNEDDTVHIKYVVKNTSDYTAKASDNGAGVWLSYRFFNNNNEPVWPYATGVLSEAATEYIILPHDELVYEFDWDGTCITSGAIESGIYSLNITDIFGNNTSYENIVIE